MRVTKGCPICVSDVLGTGETGYYCKQCNLLFSKRHIVYRHVREEVKATIRQHFTGYERDAETTAERQRHVRPFPKTPLQRTLAELRATRESLESATGMVQAVDISMAEREESESTRKPAERRAPATKRTPRKGPKKKATKKKSPRKSPAKTKPPRKASKGGSPKKNASRTGTKKTRIRKKTAKKKARR